MSNKILVTGNLGYNGPLVVRTLNEKGYHTIGLDIDYYQDCFFDLDEFLPKEQIRKDIRNIEKRDLEGINAVIHLAALSNDALGELNPKLTREINEQSTVKLAKLAKQSGVQKFIYASSCSVYGIHKEDTPASETSLIGPLTSYAKAKAEAEKELEKLHDDSFQVVIMRNATMHGMSPKLRLDLVLNNLAAYGYLYDKVKILSDGTPWRPLLSIMDFSNVVVNFLENNAKHIVYNVGFNQENYQIKELGEMIRDITGVELEINQNNTPDERSYKVDFGRLENEFPELKIKMSVKDSIKQLFDAYKKYNLKEDDLLGSKYFRIKTLKQLLEQGAVDQDLSWKEKKDTTSPDNSTDTENKIIELVKKFYQESKKEIPFDKAPVSGKVFDEQELINLVQASLEGWWTESKWNALFEKKLKEFLGIEYCLTCNSGSSANLLAVKSLTSVKLGERRIKPGDEVITVAAGFPTTINPIIQIGAIPVFVDVDLSTYNAKINEIEKAVTKKTKVIFLAHTLGNPFDLSAVKELCAKHNLWFLEDCCDALGSKYNGKYTGTFGDIATLSFYPAHHITTAEGGAVLTNNSQLYKIVRSIRDWGRDCWCGTGRDNTCGKRFEMQLGRLPLGYDHKFTFSEVGYNLKLTDLQAAIGVAQMDKLEEFIEKRKQNFDFLLNKFQEFEKYFILPTPTRNSEPSWFGFLLTIKDKNINRTELLQYLNSRGVATRLLFGGNITKQPYFIDYGIKHRKIGNLENTDEIMNNTFWIGIYHGLDKKHLNYIAHVFKEFFHK